MAELIQGVEAAAFSFVLRERRRRWSRGARRRLQAHAADVEVFLEAIGLEEIGEFESADVAPAGTDLALEVAPDAADILLAEAGAQELVPEAFTVVA